MFFFWSKWSPEESSFLRFITACHGSAWRACSLQMKLVIDRCKKIALRKDLELDQHIEVFLHILHLQSFANVISTPDRQPPVCLMRFSNGLPLLSCRFRSRRRATLQHHRWECRWKIKPGSKSMKRNTHQIWDNFCRAFFMKAAQTRPEILPNCRIWIGFEEFFLSLWRLRGSKVRFLGYWDRPHGLNHDACFCFVVL